MPFFQIDDQLPVNAKVKTLIAPVLAGDITGVAALGLWSLAGASTQASLTDGVLSFMDLAQLIPNPDLVRTLAHQLVAAGLWHAPGHGCEKCEPVPDGHWRFHDWAQMRYDPGWVVKLNRAKRKELQDPAVVNAVWARDCVDPAKPNTAWCRYCGKTVNRKDTRSTENDRATLDHVDPMAARGVHNLVVACKGCNGTKGKRTPAKAGMTLRPAPRAAQDTSAGVPESVSPSTTSAAGPTGSPDVVQVAEMPSARSTAAPRPRPATRPQADQSRTTPAPEPQQSPRARDTHGAGSGPGDGSSGMGKPQGQPAHSPAVSSMPDPPKRRRRRRGKGKRPTPQAMDAGPAEVIPTIDRFGSPWHGWTGPPSPLGDEHHCPTHSLPMPCRRCADAPEGDEA